MSLVVTVFRKGKDFTEDHVKWVGRQLPEGTRYACISKEPIEGVEWIPMKYDYPGWWSKMELFTIQEPFVFFDLDTAIIDDITFLINCDESTILRDWYHTGMVNSSVMRVEPILAERIWNAWIANPDRFMANHSVGGDQEFICPFFNGVPRIQDLYPGKFCSYKVSVVGPDQEHYCHRSTGNGSVPDGVAVVCFHGTPRPWDLKYSWIPK